MHDVAVCARSDSNLAARKSCSKPVTDLGDADLPCNLNIHGTRETVRAERPRLTNDTSSRKLVAEKRWWKRSWKMQQAETGED